MQGTLAKEALTVKLRRLDPAKHLLVSTGFRWIAAAAGRAGLPS